MTVLWTKLAKPEFTTFRFRRRDLDYQVGERLSIYYRPRRKGGGVELGDAEVKKIEPRWVIDPLEESILVDMVRDTEYDETPIVSDNEARLDGFSDRSDMIRFMRRSYPGSRRFVEPMNRLTLSWGSKILYASGDAVIDQQWARMHESKTGSQAPVALSSGDFPMRR
jgi:hypothetical protein